MGGLCMMSLPVWLSGPMYLLGGGSLCLVPCSFWGGLPPGCLCLGGGSQWKGQRLLPGRPLKWAVRILLECILVLKSPNCKSVNSPSTAETRIRFYLFNKTVLTDTARLMRSEALFNIKSPDQRSVHNRWTQYDKATANTDGYVDTYVIYHMWRW